MPRSSPPLAGAHGRARRASAAAAVVLTLVLPAGCSLFGGPDPRGAAETLADALVAGDVSQVPFDGSTGEAATTSIRTAMGDLATTSRTVTVGDVTTAPEDDHSASATLRWTWDVPGTADWSYETTAQLALAGDEAWHVQWSPTMIEPQLTATEHLATRRVQPPRADITGAGGSVLMTERDVYRFGIDKTRIPPEQSEASAAALAGALDVDATGYVTSVGQAGPEAFVPAITLRVDDPLVAAASAAAATIPGAVRLPDTAVLAPTAEFARAILGTVGPATAEIVEQSKGRVAATDTVGLSGLEQRYDEQLSGTPGLSIRAVGTDAAGAATAREVFTQPPTPGTPLAVTLHVAAQQAAESTLTDEASPAALVAVRPSTGDVLAAATNKAAGGQALATTGRAAPGSTFKIVTALALLRAGLTPESIVPCTPSVTVDGRQFTNYSDYPSDQLGQITLRAAVAHSCNTAFISQVNTVSQQDLVDAAAALGVGVDVDMGLPAFLGSVPAEAQGTEHAASMIGQGRIEMAPLDMAIVMASVVQGTAVVPEIVERPTAGEQPPTSTGADPTGSGASATSTLPATPEASSAPLTAAEADALRSMLGAVVSEGSGRALAGSGVTMAKTGTAEYGTDTPPATHGWMVAARGDLAIAVYVQDGESGSTAAGPLIARFLASVGDLLEG